MDIIFISILEDSRSQHRRNGFLNRLKKADIGIDIEKSKSVSTKYGQYNEQKFLAQQNVMTTNGFHNGSQKAVWLTAWDKRKVIRGTSNYGIQHLGEQLTVSTANYRFAPTGGEIGCWLSHRAVWQYQVDNEIEELLVLEDDADIRPDFLHDYKYWKSKLPKNYGIFYLGRDFIIQDFYDFHQRTMERMVKEYKYEKNGIRLFKSDGNWQTHAYLITLKTAKKYLKETTDIYTGIDDRMSQLQKGSTDTYCLHPSLVEQFRTKSLIKHK